ncbi:sensor histidine kinase [Nakamurella endophytica]|uniref:histidine kinase n=1 Tax=Nakamurella endophytica TaxID=1748367 RepID=A0A917SLP3_9ACTN|nr:HAMP domain-containing sensor histidine kinase [Nakamurella endophytica]GGL86971.1 hypothetical protein GCM10011594_03220 [Nakamurella endophytica]
MTSGRQDRTDPVAPSSAGPLTPGAPARPGPPAPHPGALADHGLPLLPHPPRSRWTLRARLIALVLAVAALALAAVDVLLPLNLRSSLLSDRDTTLTSVVSALPRASSGGQLDPESLAQISNDNPLRGEIGWSVVTATGIAKVVVRPAQDSASNPAVGFPPPTVVPGTVVDVDTGRQYRILAVPATVGGQRGGFLVAWSPISDINATVRRLVLLELLVTAGLLVLLGATASLVIRRELRPLEVMASAADDIAAGDLQVRVDAGDPGTEVGRLGTAFNGMLDGVGALLDERIRGEDRLRQFLADAGHELRTPVAAVQGYADLYAAGALPDRAAVGRAMDRMGFEARRMGALVEDLLTLVRADASATPDREPVELSELLGGVVDDAAVIDPSRSWRLVGDGRPVVVEGDRMRLHQLFANLLANVRTHTPPGTVATVSLLPGQDGVAVVVSDDGPGVDDADLGRIFDRFYRAEKSRSREHGGTGLGLSIVAAIVRAHGGQVMAGHSPGGGLSVTVVLPLAAGTAAVSPPPAAADADPVTAPTPVAGRSRAET